MPDIQPPPGATLESLRLSLRAFGLYAFLMERQKAGHQKTTLEDITAVFSDNELSAQAAMEELKQKGVVKEFWTEPGKPDIPILGGGHDA